MRPIRLIVASAAALSILTACQPEDDHASLPQPVSPGPDAVGHYCGMIVANHGGPRGHVFIAGDAQPIWFSTVRDVFAYLRLGEVATPVRVAYVSDMGKDDWAPRRDGAFIRVEDAYFVIGSTRAGGMGGAAIVPFADEEQARSFAAAHGGEIVRHDQIPMDHITDGALVGGSGDPAHPVGNMDAAHLPGHGAPGALAGRDGQ